MNRVINLSPSENILGGNFASGDIVLVKCDALDEAFSFTMPSAVDLYNILFIIKKVDTSSNVVTINMFNDEKSDGEATISLPNQYDSVSMGSDGYNYYQF